MSGIPVTLDQNTWRKLIAPALRVVDSLKQNGHGDLDFRLGGGTVLMFRFGHRISKDLGLFLRGERTSGAQLRAAFEDNSFRALARAGAAVGVELHTILAAYAAAKVTVVAVNPELDEALRGGW